ncbi:hypothetical protein KAW50_06535 [candidate division WOR-3 bacterium]|nr:hypothetical protein [candidate division WOR-3 bacterium]
MSIQGNIILARLNDICDRLEELDKEKNLLDIEKDGLIERLKEIKKKEDANNEN